MSSQVIPNHGREPFTDFSRWRLQLGEGGRHTWHYLKPDTGCEYWHQSEIDRYWLGLPIDAPVFPPAKNAFEAAHNGYSFLKRLQAPDGHWPGEYGGPMFLLPGLVISSYVSGLSFEEGERLEMIRYLFNRAHTDDGGWGLHIEGHSTVLGTALNYASLRLLGVDREHPVLVKARATLHRFGGASASPSWGKFWLSVLNVYEWEGQNPMPPEIWAIYLPASYRARFQCKETDVVLSLREELYTQSYESIDWPAQRNNVAEVDLYSPHTHFLDTLNAILSGTLETCSFPPLQQAALRHAYDLICMEDENTSYQDLAAVNKMIHIICRAHGDGFDSDALRKHAVKRADFMWMGPDGMRVSGTNGSQLWDTVFIAQALVETGLADLEENKESLLRVLNWLGDSQMTENPKHFETAYQQATKGAWGFSTKEQGYTLTDCTAEGLKTVLLIQNNWKDSPKPISDDRIFDSVNLLLTLQNADGGFAAYEKIRGPYFLELLNSAEMFGNIMTEYTYPECTTSVITGLSVFKKYYPDYRRNDVDCVIKNAIKYLHAAQRLEGGRYGSWGICFTYATMFSLESLSLVGETYATSRYVRKACDFLLEKQMLNGGWGESYKSCELERYVQHERSQVVQTSWAAMALMHAHYPRREPIDRAVRLVMSRQQKDGSWAQEAIEGVFNKSCAISYPNFKNSFTTWMLGKAHKYLKTL